MLLHRVAVTGVRGKAARLPHPGTRGLAMTKSGLPDETGNCESVALIGLASDCHAKNNRDFLWFNPTELRR